MTEKGRRTPLRQRREERRERTAAAREEHWAVRFAAADTPLEAVRATWEQFRTRCIQRERRATARVERAKTSAAREAAERRLAATRDEIRAVCEQAARTLAELTDRIERR
ncbi:hypothetical protein GCM10023196_036440 [Actinoallomurus vinaceus]|uniref:Uncharacterized protein n=1 Tax=Actinoallomurus vinaceus TaxID=1080074 RepID=A0ABP8UDQ1_9ACTN